MSKATEIALRVQQFAGERFKLLQNRLVWRALTLVSLTLVAFAVVRTLDQASDMNLTVRPAYIVAAFGVYIVTYIMHMLGWHVLARSLMGYNKLSGNVQAFAQSDLVKHLPTVFFHIANRVHFYEKEGVSKKSVVGVSLLELVIMVGTGGILYLALSFSSLNLLAINAALLALALTFYWLRRSQITQWWQRSLGTQMKAIRQHVPSVLLSTLLYGLTWPIAAFFLMFLIDGFAVTTPDQTLDIMRWWLIAGLAGYAISLTLGMLAIAREATLAFFIGQVWSPSIGIAVALAVKLILTIGPIVCAFAMLGLLKVKNVFHE